MKSYPKLYASGAIPEIRQNLRGTGKAIFKCYKARKSASATFGLVLSCHLCNNLPRTAVRGH